MFDRDTSTTTTTAATTTTITASTPATSPTPTATTTTAAATFGGTGSASIQTPRLFAREAGRFILFKIQHYDSSSKNRSCCPKFDTSTVYHSIIKLDEYELVGPPHQHPTVSVSQLLNLTWVLGFRGHEKERL